MRRALGALALACVPAHAQEGAVPQEPIVVSATREETRAFDAPAAISAVDADTLRTAGPMVNLSEALVRIPGLTVLNRQNFSQDLQLSVRGFGARSTFGIRGVRLIVDGIPATMPDGQGQASSVSLPSAARIEVLRGPLALLYGNAAGGVVMVVTGAGAPQPTLGVSASAGSFDARRAGLSLAAGSGPHALTVEASRFQTGGYRDHSEAERAQLNAKWSWTVSSATRMDAVVNHFDQPRALDPLGLTRAQWEENPRQAPALAFQQDARKTVRQSQAGVVVEHRFDAETTFKARLHAGRRDLDNALSVPPAAQATPTSSGGIVVFERDYSGIGLQLARRFALGPDTALRLLGGVELDRMEEYRQGYVNSGGRRGELKRDEDNTVANRDALLQGILHFGERWDVIAGVRASRVRFETRDRFVVPGNPDDSGEIEYRGTNPVAGITFRAHPGLNLYANLARGFETPTFTELAYRTGASGLNAGLQASGSRHGEMGGKWRAPGHALDAAAFEIRTDDEIVVEANVGGRSTFRNGGPTVRRGLELAHTARWSPEWRSHVALTVLRARFDSAFTSGSGSAAVPVARGNRLPGTPERTAFAELVYEPRCWPGFQAGLEVLHMGRIFVNDANEDFAPTATVASLRAKLTWQMGGVELEPLLRLENVTGRRYSGSVIVNEGNRRFFEPAAGRGWLAAVNVRYRF